MERLTFDDRNVMTESEVLSKEGKRVARQNGISVWQFEHDARGRVIVQRSLNAAGEPVARDDGCIVVKQTYDARGNFAESSCWMPDGARGASKQKVHRFTRTYDDRDRAIQTDFYDDQEKLITSRK
jgi:hypothetical protein